ncbi:ribonuclease BN [Thermoclostridium stercorarium subsp. stercorarium DSM 8532]|jgi:membrane protein|uniref:Ribonuclease BN n=3 Tax=Thermoclostridium stercorarium TaxID=1510 RepID=L7VL70_THES1|nr:YihY/virulence factor BrkB family protein [Thermoclostridium stercorarium]AGC67216.1 ribonuclease BN [Thermoclostridium stercorarium subsp. stercorarium DSM 8532]AGI38290.1 membrane protein [Thermoclostridium stercorarium subsp. stercorarium DSM 8532]ANW97681.1 ribonuclease BN [Thermoclostridium stercorarium subsp. thermolacticum DSM 2910]ANX00244.1 ribonuclease BN [Thermoclostridium stercorarium subsp. leptospartum DSM 9219]
MKELLKKTYDFGKNAYNIYSKAKVPFLAAQTSFYVILAFFPFVAFILTLIQETHLDDTLFIKALSNFLPSSTYVLTLQVLESAQAHKNLFISIGGAAASIWPFTKAVQSLIVSINTVYGMDEENLLKRIGFSLILTFAFIILIILSTILLLFGHYLGRIVFEYLGSPEAFIRIWDYLRYEFSVLVLLAIFMVLYKTVPRKKVKLGEIFPGAAVATILWLVLSSAFSFFMNRSFRFATIYGGIAGIILLIIWLYWAMHVILIGAVINVANSDKKRRGSFHKSSG